MDPFHIIGTATEYKNLNVVNKNVVAKISHKEHKDILMNKALLIH